LVTRGAREASFGSFCRFFYRFSNGGFSEIDRSSDKKVITFQKIEKMSFLVKRANLTNFYFAP